MEEIIEQVKVIRGLIDDLYELGPRKKEESNLYMTIDNELNKLQGLCYSEVAHRAKEG